MNIPYLAERLAELSCPVLAFWGSNDRMMPDSGILALAKNCSNLKLIILSECGHWVMVEHTELFNRECLAFLG
jgi:4,5:9,10-diseco-3-hydroxy-5,9,17-trioxoandrosta-1(10),2-diene-4-oate hydrolase